MGEVMKELVRETLWNYSALDAQKTINLHVKISIPSVLQGAE